MMPLRMKWDKARILSALRKLHRAGANLAYSALAKRNQALLSAAAYHFASYRDAIEQAGIDYAVITRRPRWTKQAIIAQSKQARRRGQDLHWSAVTRRSDELARAAFASLQPRLFGRWDRALHAAGLDADDVSIYRTWDRNTIVFELRARYQAEEAMNSAAVQQEDPALHAAAVRYFGSYERALRAGRFNPKAIRRRRRWSRADVIAALKKAHQRGANLSDSAIRRQSPALYGAAARMFGSYSGARKAAGVSWKKGNRAAPGAGEKQTVTRAVKRRA